MQHLVVQLGYAAVFLLVMVESLGVPLPGETILITAAIYAGTTHKLSIGGIFAVAAAAAVIGGTFGFFIGEKGGYRLLRRYGRRVHLDETKIKVGRLFFERRGPSVVFFGRFISVLRTYVAFLAGTLRMDWRRFTIYNVAGAVVWAALYSFVPFAIGHAINRVSTWLDIVIGGAAVIAVVGAVLVVRNRSKKYAAEAEAAYPGPLPER